MHISRETSLELTRSLMAWQDKVTQWANMYVAMVTSCHILLMIWCMQGLAFMYTAGLGIKSNQAKVCYLFLHFIYLFVY